MRGLFIVLFVVSTIIVIIATLVREKTSTELHEYSLSAMLERADRIDNVVLWLNARTVAIWVALVSGVGIIISRRKRPTVVESVGSVESTDSVPRQ